ncbi:MAG: DUF1801 domain-containing protein [Niameybacter sp.]|uniref:DUF1801 domain-containing protein n=1 Tax=Niameybacter sp. TaxID=2033640 RepID=UPI002FC59BBC
MDKIQDYINQFEDPKREWLEQLVTFMREQTQLQECFDDKMPTYKGHDFYVAFAAQKNYFSFYTDEVSVLEIFKAEMSSTSLGKSCARIKYKEDDALNLMMQITKEIIMMHRDTRKDAISDLNALKKWKAIPEHGRKILSSNVFCGNCGVTTLEQGFAVHDDAPYGIILRGKCEKCGGEVARCVESD